jgi:ribosomal protein S18 acetylase RimI-like enzyme
MPSTEIQVHEATPQTLDDAARLFDLYRQFYKQPPDLAGARAFLTQRLEARDSAIYLATAGARTPAGFMQLYPTHSSISMRPTWILNDLFVLPSHRKLGIATRLIQAAQEHATRAGAKSLALSTARDNLAAQKLYESLGWVQDREFLNYDFEV